MLAFLLPWGMFAVCGRSILAWLIGDNPNGDTILTASLRLMTLLAVFFVFDFAINFLSALLRAAKEQVYLLTTTVSVAGGFGILLVMLPAREDGICLIGTFISVQAIWAALSLQRVASRWPGRRSIATPRIPLRVAARVGPTHVWRGENPKLTFLPPQSFILLRAPPRWIEPASIAEQGYGRRRASDRQERADGEQG